MKHTPSLWHIIFALLLVVTFAQPAACHTPVWDERLVPPGCGRRRYNPRRNRERWARRWAKRRRRRPPVSRAARRRRRKCILREILNANPSPVLIAQRKQRSSAAAVSARATVEERSSLITETSSEPDPLADLRQARGWIDQMDERELLAMLIRIRWPQGAQCSHCGERDLRYVKLIDADYRGGLGRWGCQVCAEAGDPGEGGTFTPFDRHHSGRHAHRRAHLVADCGLVRRRQSQCGGCR